MGYWYAIVPRPDLYDRVNYIKNPSFEESVSDNWTASGTTPSQLTHDAVFGLAAGRLTTGSGDNYIKSNQVSVADDETVVATAYVRNNTSTTVDASIRIYDATNTAVRATTTQTAASDWIRLIATWKNTTGSAANVELRLGNFTSSTTSQIDVDAAQLVIYGSTVAAADVHELDYFDGDSDDAVWLGRAHNSTTRISRDTKEHGQILNLADDLGLLVETLHGAGLATVRNSSTELALGDGAVHQRTRTSTRTISLSAIVDGSSLANLLDQRRALVEALQPDRGRRGQAIRLFHLRPGQTYGDPTWREVRAIYDSGLEIQRLAGHVDKFNLRLLAPDPSLAEEKAESAALDPSDSPSATRFYTKEDGIWSAIANANANGAINFVYWSENLGLIVIGGTFTNWNNIGAADYIVGYDRGTGTFTALSSGLNGQPRAAQDAPDGVNLYVVGDFTANGGATVNMHRVGYFDGSAWNNADTSSDVASGTVYDLTFDEYGDLYLVGTFTDFDGVSTLDHSIKYDMSATSWSVMGASGTGAATYVMAADHKGGVYLAGIFTLSGSDGFCRYNIAGNSFEAICNSTGIYLVAPAKMLIAKTGDIYIAGDFSTADGVVCALKVTKWNGNAFSAMSGGLAGHVHDIALDPDTGELYAFDIEDTNYDETWAIWNGSSWRWGDAYLTSVATQAGAVQGGDLFLASEGTSPAVAGTVTVDNTGTERAWPIITIAIGTSGAGRLISIKNETTGAGLYFGSDIPAGDKVVIDTRPGRRGITAGTRINLVGLATLSEFFLAPGENLISCFVRGAASSGSAIEWHATYSSVD